MPSSVLLHRAGFLFGPFLFFCFGLSPLAADLDNPSWAFFGTLSAGSPPPAMDFIFFSFLVLSPILLLVVLGLAHWTAAFAAGRPTSL